MRKLFRLLALITIPLFAIRLLNVLLNIDPVTGFYTNDSRITIILSLAFLVVALILMAVQVKKSPPSFGAPSAGTLPASFFCISALSTAVGSVFLLLGVFSQVTLKEIFMSRRALLEAGFVSSHFRIEFWCSLIGFVAAAWFLFAAVRFLRDGDLSGHPWFCCVPVIWFCLRALADYSIAPVNPNNTIILASLAADLVLAVFFFRFCRFAALGHPPDDLKKLVVPALLVFIFTISFKSPLVVFAVETSFAEALYIISDSFAAAAAFCLTDKLLKENP